MGFELTKEIFTGMKEDTILSDLGVGGNLLMLMALPATVFFDGVVIIDDALTPTKGEEWSPKPHYKALKRFPKEYR